MTRAVASAVGLLGLLAVGLACEHAPPPKQALETRTSVLWSAGYDYPATRRSSDQPRLFGWLEDGEAPEVKNWIAQQTGFFGRMIQRPWTLAFERRLATAMNEVWEGPVARRDHGHGGRYFRMARSPSLEPQLVFRDSIYGVDHDLSVPGEVLAWSASPDGSKVAAIVAAPGNQGDLIVVDVDSGSSHPIVTNAAIAAPAWLDSMTFAYAKQVTQDGSAVPILLQHSLTAPAPAAAASKKVKKKNAGAQPPSPPEDLRLGVIDGIADEIQLYAGAGAVLVLAERSGSTDGRPARTDVFLATIDKSDSPDKPDKSVLHSVAISEIRPPKAAEMLEFGSASAINKDLLFVSSLPGLAGGVWKVILPDPPSAGMKPSEKELTAERAETELGSLPQGAIVTGVTSIGGRLAVSYVSTLTAGLRWQSPPEDCSAPWQVVIEEFKAPSHVLLFEGGDLVGTGPIAQVVDGSQGHVTQKVICSEGYECPEKPSEGGVRDDGRPRWRVAAPVLVLEYDLDDVMGPLSLASVNAWTSLGGRVAFVQTGQVNSDLDATLKSCSGFDTGPRVLTGNLLVQWLKLDPKPAAVPVAGLCEGGGDLRWLGTDCAASLEASHDAFSTDPATEDIVVEGSPDGAAARIVAAIGQVERTRGPDCGTGVVVLNSAEDPAVTRAHSLAFLASRVPPLAPPDGGTLLASDGPLICVVPAVQSH